MADNRDPRIGTPTVQKRGTARGTSTGWIVGLIALILAILLLGWLWGGTGGSDVEVFEPGESLEPVVPPAEGTAPATEQGTTAPAQPVQQ